MIILFYFMKKFNWNTISNKTTVLLSKQVSVCQQQLQFITIIFPLLLTLVCLNKCFKFYILN